MQVCQRLLMMILRFSMVPGKGKRLGGAVLEALIYKAQLRVGR